MLSLNVNGLGYFLKSKDSLLEACEKLGLVIPRFCYHESLLPEGNCRVCLVEVEGSEKLIASCVTDAESVKSIWIDSPFIKKAREKVFDYLLINHPLDCPICDQAGECDLQDQTRFLGNLNTNFLFNKRGVENKHIGPVIETVMTRCIHCTRCVRYSAFVAGTSFFGTLNRGGYTEIGSYVNKFFNSEVSGNVVDLCPVGALTSKPYSFTGRPWEMKQIESIDVSDSLGSKVYHNYKNTTIMRTFPKKNSSLNGNFISDKARYHFEGNNKNRLMSYYSKDSINLSKSNFDEIYDVIQEKLSLNQKFTFLIDPTVSFETITILKKIEQVFPNQVFLTCVNTHKAENLYLHRLFNNVSDMDQPADFYFLFSLNPKIEATLVNLRLRRKTITTKAEILSVGASHTNDLIGRFFIFDYRKFFTIFKGKNSSFSQLIRKKSIHCSIDFTSGMKSADILNIYLTLKKFSKKVNLFKINEAANTEAVTLLNIPLLASNSLITENVEFYQNIVFVELTNGFITNKLMQQFSNFAKTSNNSISLFWINSHGGKLVKKCDFIIPVLSRFETNGLYINSEGRPQLTGSQIQKINEVYSAHETLKKLFFSSIQLKLYYIAFHFIAEIIEEQQKFHQSIPNNLNNTAFIKVLSNNNFLNSMPLKLMKSNSYISDMYSENSDTLLKCFKEQKKITLSITL